MFFIHKIKFRPIVFLLSALFSTTVFLLSLVGTQAKSNFGNEENTSIVKWATVDLKSPNVVTYGLNLGAGSIFYNPNERIEIISAEGNTYILGAVGKIETGQSFNDTLAPPAPHKTRDYIVPVQCSNGVKVIRGGRKVLRHKNNIIQVVNRSCAR